MCSPAPPNLSDPSSNPSEGLSRAGVSTGLEPDEIRANYANEYEHKHSCSVPESGRAKVEPRPAKPARPSELLARSEIEMISHVLMTDEAGFLC
jgi:hypothetical protein